MAAVDDLHAELAPIAQANYTAWILARTPPAMQSDMATLCAADIAIPFNYPTTKAIVSNGQTGIVVHDNGGGVNAKSPGVATVAAHAVSFVTLAA